MKTQPSLGGLLAMVYHRIKMLNVLAIIDANNSPSASVFTPAHSANLISFPVKCPGAGIQIDLESFWNVRNGTAYYGIARITRVHEDDEIFHE